MRQKPQQHKKQPNRFRDARKLQQQNQEQNKVRHGQLPYSSILLTVFAI